MSDTIDPVAAQQFALSVVRKLREAGFHALWAGGCVRDRLRGERPKDYDVATDGRPEQIRRVFGPRRTRNIGAAFGVVSVVGPHSAGSIEVATFRRDEGYSDGRHPDHVSFSTAEEDARRRDFTINGLFFDPIRLEVIDFVQGRADLEAGIIRCIGQPRDRFAEDKLRMLRAVRFATTLGYRVDPHTLAAIQDQADDIRLVSAERIAAEMRQVLRHPNRMIGIHLLRQSGLWRLVLPEYARLPAPQQEAAWTQMESVLDNLQTSHFPTALAAMLWPVSQAGRAEAESVVVQLARRWRLAKLERSQAIWLLQHVTTPRYGRQVPWPQLQRVLIHAWAPELLTLAHAVSLGIDDTEQDILFCRQQLQLPRDVLDPPPLVDGYDLRRLGIPAGPQFSTLLQGVRDAQLEQIIHDRQDALAWLQEHWKQLCPHE